MQQLYPWNDWFGKAVLSKRHSITIKRGKHYHCSSSSMAQQIRSAASSRNLAVSVIEIEDGFTILIKDERKPINA